MRIYLVGRDLMLLHVFMSIKKDKNINTLRKNDLHVFKGVLECLSTAIC